MKLFLPLIGCFALVFIQGCDISKDKNLPPQVFAGQPFEALEEIAVELTARVVDLDSSNLSYRWIQTSGTAVQLNNNNTLTAFFTAPTTTSPIQLEFEITAQDSSGNVGKDSIRVTIIPVNTLPIIDPLDSKLILESQRSSVTATAVDNDGEIISVLWEQISGTSVLIESYESLELVFTAPIVSESEDLLFRITVIDNEQGQTSQNLSYRLLDAHDIPYTQKLNDTGISYCADYAFTNSNQHNNNLECNQTSDPDGDNIPFGQDGHFQRDSRLVSNESEYQQFNYVKIGADGNPLPDDATEWSCVLDTVTGLMWEVKSSGTGINSNLPVTWFDSDLRTNGGFAGSPSSGDCINQTCDTQRLVALINEEGMCGVNDWRLPTKTQLDSLVDYSVEPSIEMKYFPNTQGFYWTASSYADDYFKAWYIRFTDGNDAFAGKGGQWHARLVRFKD